MTNRTHTDIRISSLLIMLVFSIFINMCLFAGLTFSKPNNAKLIERIELLRIHSTPFSDKFVEVGLEFPTLSLSEQLVIAQYRLEHGHPNQ